MMNGYIFTRIQVNFKLIVLFFLFVAPFSGFAQYDYEHYVPPFYDGSYTSYDIGYHKAILSTNSVKDIVVHIYRGYNDEIAQVTINNKNPFFYPFLNSNGAEKGYITSYPSDYNFPENIVGAKELNKVLANDGLRFYSSDGPFFVNMRHSTRDQGASLTTKGTYAYGTEFLSGHTYTYQNSATSRRSHFISVMATEDNTIVNFSNIKVSILTEYNPTTKSLEPKSISPSDVITVTLNKGESYVIGVDHDLPGFSTADMNAMNGTSVTSDKPIVVNSGSWTSGASGQDIGVDQIVPIDQVRNEYIVMRGKGNSTTERIILVATEDDVDVEVNGISVGNIAKKGDYMILKDPYDSNGNAYILSNKNIYVYQTLSGSSSIIGPTVGMNFIPPVSTSGIREVTVPYAEILSEKGVNGVITILSQAGAVISYSKNGEETLHPISDISGTPKKIAGVPQWEIYKLDKNLTGSYRFYSNKAINVAWLVESRYVGAAGYYSGFTKAISKIIPNLDVSVAGNIDLICESYDGDIQVTIKDPAPDFYEWYVDDFTKDPIIVNDPLVVPAPDNETSYFVVGSYRDPLMDQLYNGTFSELSVNSDYTEVHGNLQNPGEYTLVRQTTDADPSYKHPVFKDMDNDYMFMGISKNYGDTIYRGTSVDVVDGFNYIVKVFGRSVVNSTYTTPQSLKVLVNGDTIVSNFKIDNTNAWQSVSALWKPKGAANAIIKLLNNNASGVHSAFALDSITFVQAVQDTAEFVARVVPNYSYSNNGQTFHFCEGVQNSLDVSNGDTSWYDYSWAKKDDVTNTYVDLVDDSEFSGTKTNELIFLNPQQASEGNYRCTIGFKPDYQQCGSADSNVNVDLTVLVDKAATVNIEANKTHFCEGLSASLTALVTGDAGEVKWYVNGSSDPVSLENPFVFKDYAAGTYTIKCEAENGCGIASDQVTLEVLSAPVLNQLTVNDNLCEGSNIILTADATGDGTLTYSWKEGTTDLSETGSVLTLPATMDYRSSIFSVSVASQYTIGAETISCSDGTTLSQQDLDIYPNVTFTKLLENGDLCEGAGNHTFSVELTQPELFYDFTWQKDGVDISGTASEKIISPIATTDAGLYKVIVSNRCDTKESTANLAVTQKMVVNSITTDQIGPFCSPTNVTVSFDDNGAVDAYKAQKPDGTIINITNPYTVLIDNASEGKWIFSAEPICSGVATTKEFTWEMIPDFGNLSMSGITTCIGKNVDFTVDIDAIPTLSDLTYEWRDNLNKVIAGEISDVLHLTNVQDADLGNYSCTVSDQCGRSKIVNATLAAEKVNTTTTATAIEKCVGDTDFKITIDYVGTPSFEWTFDDPNSAVISTADNFAIASVSKADEGVYYCKVTLGCGDIINIQRELIVHEHVSIVSPADETINICQGEEPILNIEVNGNVDNYTIDWTDNSDVSLGFGDVKQIQLPVNNTPGTYTYKAHVDSYCDNLVKKYNIIVHEKPVLSTLDNNVQKCAGLVSLNASVTGENNGISWWKEGLAIDDGNGDDTDYVLNTASSPTDDGTYIVKVSSDYCGDDQISIQLDIRNEIVVTAQSAPTTTVCENELVNLSVSADGDDIQYKWYKDGTPSTILSTQPNFEIAKASVFDSGTYKLELSNDLHCGDQTLSFDVVVNQNPVITANPVDKTICETAANESFNVTASVQGTAKYQWYNNSGIIPGATSATYTETSPIDGETYYCEVKGDACGIAKSNKATLHVIQQLSATDPVDMTIADGGNASFTITASGEPDYSYQWQVNNSGWSNLTNSGFYSGVNSKTLVVTAANLTLDGKQYRCVVTTSGAVCANTVTSSAATLNVSAVIKIFTQPENQETCLGSPVEFTLLGTKAGLNYTWEFSTDGVTFNPADGVSGMSVSLSGSTSKLNISAVTLAMDSWKFRCIVGDGLSANDTSSEVAVSVSQPVDFINIANLNLCADETKQIEITGLSGTKPYAYSWKKEGTEVSTSSILNIAAADNGNYSLSVGNDVCGDEVKNFTVNHYSVLSIDPWDNATETCEGNSETLTAKANVDPSLSETYAWYKDGVDQSIATNDYSLNINNKSQSGQYTLIVDDGCSTESVSGYLTVFEPVVANNSWDANTELCEGSELNLQVQVTGDVKSYSWTHNGNPLTATTNYLVEAVSDLDKGEYKCTVTDNCGNSFEYATSVNVLKAPEITSGLDGLTAVCEGEALELGPISINNSYNSITWTLNDDSKNNTAGTSLILGAATTNMEGNYKVEVANKCGTVSSVGTQVVNPAPSLTPMSDQTVCEGEDVMFRVEATGRDLTYQWKVDNVDQGVSLPVLLRSGLDVLPSDPFTPKTYEIVCIVSNDNGCGEVLSDTAKLVVNPSTTLKSTLQNQVVYVGQDAKMTIDITGYDLVYSWTHEKDGVTTPLPSETGPSIDFTNVQKSDAGYYNCVVTGSCGVRLASGKLTVKEPVVVNDDLANFVEKCVGEPLNITVNATGQTSSIKWFKDGIDTGVTELNFYIPELSLSDAATYQCQIKGEGIDQINVNYTVRVYPNTSLNLPIGDKPACEGEALDWSPDITGAADLKYSWLLEGVEVSTDKILHYDATSLSDEGNYELKVTGLCGDVSSSGSLEVTELPAIVNVSSSKEICENTSVEFTVEASGENLKYQWQKNGTDMAGKTTPVLSLTSVQLDDAATYNCAVSNSCNKITSADIVLNITPQLRILTEEVDKEICAGEDAEFRADVDGNNVTYQWKLNGVDIVGATDSIYKIGSGDASDKGYYTCVVSDLCTDTRSTKPTQLIVNELPNTEIFGRMVLCAKEDRVTYTTIDQPEINYGWDVNGGVFAGAEEGLRTRVTWGESNNGVLSVIISDLDTGCESKVDSLVTLNALPSVSLQAFESKGVCEESFVLAGGYPEGGIYWVDDISQEVFDPADKGPGNYKVHYSFTDNNGCSNLTSTKTLRVDTLPTVDITDDITIGSCKPFQLTAKTTEDNIQWSPASDLDDEHSFNPTFSPGESQVLVASVTDQHGCVGIDIMNLNVAPLPEVNTIADTTVGQCNQLQLLTDIVGDAGDISWTNPETLDDSETRSPKIINASEGVYTYKINVTDLYGCDASDEVVVNMVADPVLNEDKFGCQGDEFEVNIAGMINPVWEDGYVEDLRTIETPGTYKLEVSNEYGCGDQQTFVINPTPAIDLKDTLIFEGETVTLSANLPMEFSPYQYTWQDGSIFPRFEVSETGMYKLKVEDNLGCMAMDSAYVEVKPIGIESPSAFTPNSNNENDRFYLKDINVADEFELYVYDRWGELLFKSNETGYNGGWDGTYKGKLCPTGAYVWIAFINGKLTNKGTFMLVR